MSDDLSKANKELSNLQKEGDSLVKKIREEYDRIMQEFENEYPPLKIVDTIRFTQDELQESLLRLQKNNK